MLMYVGTCYVAVGDVKNRKKTKKKERTVFFCIFVLFLHLEIKKNINTSTTGTPSRGNSLRVTVAPLSTMVK